MTKDRLTEVRREHDDLKYELDQNLHRLAKLREQQERFEKLHAEQGPDADAESIMEHLKNIEKMREEHEQTSDQLKHMHLAYKADILIQHKKMQCNKENLRKDRQKIELRKKEFQNLSKECDKYWGMIVGAANQNALGEDADEKQVPEEAHLDDEMVAMQGRSAWNYIEIEEKKMEAEEQYRMAAIRAREDNKARETLKGQLEAKMSERNRLDRKKNEMLVDVAKLPQILHSSMNRNIDGKTDHGPPPSESLRNYTAEDLILNYNGLINGREKIKDIKANYQRQVEAMEEDIKQLQEEYLHQKYEEQGLGSRYDSRDHFGRIMQIFKDHQTEFSRRKEGQSEGFEEELAMLRNRLVNLAASNNKKEAEGEEEIQDEADKLEKIKNEYDLDALVNLEKQYSESFKENFKQELEIKRMTAIVNSACTTVSRIMFQLDKNVGLLHAERQEL